MRTVLYMHTGSGNHGCEALVRTTTRMVKDYLNSDVILWSGSKEEELKYGVDKVVDKIVVTDELNKKTLGFLKAYVKYKFMNDNSSLHKEFIKKLFSNSIAISIGGDNYCYPWSANMGVEIDKEIRHFCKKNVFWGCSIEEEFMSHDIVNDLKGFDLITVRESLSYEVLKKFGIKSVKVADPAFLLNARKTELPDGFHIDNTVGINISPLITDYESGENISLDNYINLIRYILTETNMSICLIPHVIWDYNDDLAPLTFLYEMFKDNSRITLLSDRTCEEIKYIISKCRFFVGSRTHATIAAYSTCVPTLAVGYSIKSKGIAKDIFGTYDNYVISVQNLKSDTELLKGFKYLLYNEKTIKNLLVNKMPCYKNNVDNAGEMLRILTRGN